MSFTDEPFAASFLAIVQDIRQSGLPADLSMVEAWIGQTTDPALRGEMARLLGFFWLRKADTPKAVHYSDLAARLLPHSTDAVYNAAFACLQAGLWADAIRRGQDAIARFGDQFQWHNLLCTAHGRLGQMAEARLHGTRCLELKDASATEPAAVDLTRVPVPPFDPSRPERNAISFSLFGDNERYIRTAVLNVRAARYLYLGWRCHVFVDGTVPAPTVDALVAEGAAVLRVNGLPSNPFGTFWRFLVADNPDIDRYIVRDADSVVNIREAGAVQEWTRSNKHFHVMRDNYDHGELVLAGMWGGVRGALPSIVPWARSYLASRQDLVGRTADQEFLRDRVWPIMRTSVMTHDSLFAFGECRDFPAACQLPPGFHVGCDGRAMLGLTGRGAG